MSGRIANALDLVQVPTPTSPVSGRSKLYFKSDGLLYYKQSSGSEAALYSPDNPNLGSTGSTVNAIVSLGSGTTYAYANHSHFGVGSLTSGNSNLVLSGPLGDSQGALTITAINSPVYPAGTVDAGAFIVRGAAGTVRDVAFYSATSLRWTVRTEGITEAGSNSGSNFQIIGRDDSGAALHFFVIDRATGQTTLPGQLKMNVTNAGVEIGSTSTSNTPFIDFHSSGNNNDYDARIIASGGSSSIELGTLTMRAAAVVATAALTAGTQIVATSGDITASNGDVYAKSSTASTGYVKMTKGTTANAGYNAYFGTDGVRHGYIGFGAGAGTTTDTGEIRYVSGQHLFSGPIYENTQRVYSPNNPPPPSGAVAIPLSVASGSSLTIATNTQAYAPLDIVFDGELILDGELVFG